MGTRNTSVNKIEISALMELQNGGREREKERNPNSNKKPLKLILGETGLSIYENSTILDLQKSSKNSRVLIYA